MPVRARGLHASLAGLAAVTLLALGGPALAACTLPVPPDPATRPAKPAVPVKGACVGAKPGTPGCIGVEAFRYNDDVKAYNAKLAAWKPAADAYVARLNAFVQASAEYARCEVQALQ